MFLLEHIDVACVDPDLRIRCPKLLFNTQSDIFITAFKSNNIHANDNREATVSYMPFYGSLKMILIIENYNANLPIMHNVNAGPDFRFQNSKQTSTSCAQLGCIP